MKSLAECKVKSIQYPHCKYLFGSPAKVEDEGSFYRIDNNHIIDKFKVEGIDMSDGLVIFRMRDQEIILEVE